jgi:hypothetical protein
MLARDPEARSTRIAAGEAMALRVFLNDGRVLALRSTVLPPRPHASVIARNVTLPRGAQDAKIRVASDSGLPQGATLTFSLRSDAPAFSAANPRVEVSSLDGGFSTTLTLARNQLKIAGPGVVVATLDPAREFGSAAFGPLRFRVVIGEVAGDWTPLTTLVRMPELAELKCPAATDAACSLSGADLYLIESVARGADFADAVSVPEGFPGDLLLVPHPRDEGLYVKLRDDPSAAHPVELRAQAHDGPR